MKPSLGRIVLYRSKTGTYTVPAMITATTESLSPRGVEAGAIPALSSSMHVHLTVFTPGTPGKRIPGVEIPQELAPHGIAENLGGSYPEWDIPHCPDQTLEVSAAFRSGAHDISAEDFPPGTWAWPARG